MIEGGEEAAEEDGGDGGLAGAEVGLGAAQAVEENAWARGEGVLGRACGGVGGG